MTRNARLGWLAAAGVVAVIAIVILASSGGSSSSPTSTSEAGITVHVKSFKPVGGIQTLTVKKGHIANYTVISDKPEEIHTHGYNIAKDVAPGKPAKFAFKATIDGVFDVELEHHGVQIMSLKVEP
jgi:hypothetical protein